MEYIYKLYDPADPYYKDINDMYLLEAPVRDVGVTLMCGVYCKHCKRSVLSYVDEPASCTEHE